MNTLLKKELRLLLPSWAVALVLAFSACLIADHQSSTSFFRVNVLVALPFVLTPALVVMLALDSLGRELSAGTFSNLLAQPVSRSRVWWTKTVLLGVVISSVWAAWWFSVSTNPKLVMGAEERHEVFTATLLVALTVYSGGLWTVMLLRQVAAAFWFTLLIPAFFAGLTAHFTGKYGSEDAILRNIVVVITLYSLAGFFWAQRMFLRAEDVAWTGGNITLPGWLKLPGRTVPAAAIRGQRPRLALITKEFQLHQSTFVIAGVLTLLHVGILVARKFGDGFKDSPALATLAEVFWVFWPVLPLMIGCVAVAEERKLGTLEAQLCLPVRRWTQFIAKLGVAMALAVFFGVIIPLLFEGGRILPEIHLGRGASNDESPLMQLIVAQPVLLALVEMVDPLLPFLPLTLFAVTFLCMAFYASTLARNTLQAIAPAIVGMMVAWTLLIGATFVEDLVHYPLWRGSLIYFIGVPVLTTTLVALTYWNFKRVLVGWQVWRRNLIVLIGALGFVTTTTTAIYQRAWELLLRLEPAHGPARLAAGDIVTMSLEGYDATIQFADGRSWPTRFYIEDPGLAGLLFSEWEFQQVPGSRFMTGSNWVSVVQFPLDVIGLQKDGSLWVSDEPDQLRRIAQIRRGSEQPQSEAVRLVRYGNDSDWRNLVGRWSVAFALKNDGTLWRIGTNRFNWNQWPGLRSFAPQRAGVDADWAEISMLGDHLVFRKLDGRVYVHPAYTSPPGETLKLDENTILERAPHLQQTRWRGLAWTSARGGQGSFQVGVAEDGTFRVAGDYQQQQGKLRIVASNVQLGAATNWVGLAALYGPVVTLKADGTLWMWKFPENPRVEPESASATRLGRHSDWVAVTAAFGGCVSLAADGNLWYWYPSQGFGPEGFQILRTSRKPQLVGNIFAQAQ